VRRRRRRSCSRYQIPSHYPLLTSQCVGTRWVLGT
jgi:hypothetical protein